MTLLAGAALAAALELDAAHVAQTLVSRPFFVGALLGVLHGQAELGAGLGAAFELLSLPEAPLGGHLRWSAPVAAAVSALAAGAGATLPVAFVGGLFAGWVHARLEWIERGLRVSFSDALARRAEAGRKAPWGALLGTSAAVHFVLTFVVVAFYAAGFAAADRAIIDRLPLFLIPPLGSAVMCAPVFGLVFLAVKGARA